MDISERKKIPRNEFPENESLVNKRFGENKTTSKGRLSHLLELLNKVKSKSEHRKFLSGKKISFHC